MTQPLRLGIVGYGNIGRGVEAAIRCASDCHLVAVFTRRDPETLALATPGAVSARYEDLPAYVGKLDVLLLCGGSMSDLPMQGPHLAGLFNTVDTFDTHAKIPDYLSAVDASARNGGKVSVISAGWDPGLFSMVRLLGQAVLPDGQDYTFWGSGVSQGHSDALRRVEGVTNAIEYTIPVQEAIAAVRSGGTPTLSARQKHTRMCYVVAEPDADLAQIERDIKAMPNYFSDYDTTVCFISAAELAVQHSGMPHAGLVLRSGTTGEGEQQHLMEFSLKLDSNPAFTGSVLVAFARATARLASSGKSGGFTPFDIPLCYLSERPREQLIQELL